MDSLIDKTTPNKVINALEILPKGPDALSHAYGEAIKRIRSQRDGFRRLAEDTLLWLTCTKRLLTILELRHALAVQPGNSEFDENDLEDANVITSVCAGLVTVDKESNIIRLAHETTREFLQTHIFCLTVKSEEDPILFDRQRNKIAMMQAHKYLAITCVAYLSFDIFESRSCKTTLLKKILQSHPFYDYATHNWGHHARVASIKKDKMILDFLENDEKVSASSQAMMTSKAYIGYNKETPWKMAGMHLAAIFGLSCEIIISLLERSHGLNVRDTYGRTPLAWAAEEGHKAVVNLLLAQEGIDEDSEDNVGRTPLSLAAEKGHEAVVEALLARDSVEAHSCDIFDQTPLLWAAENGHEAVAKLLLERADIDVNFKEMYFQKTPLSAAAEKGHEAVVKLLLAREDVNVNYKDGVGRTPLSLAAEKGHAVVVKLLLAREDLNVDDKDNVGRTPLLLAAENGHEAIVKLLLTKIGIDRDSARKLYGQAPLLRVVDAAKISYGWTPVPFVVEKGYMSVSQLLIMDMNLTDQVGRTPLLWAAEMGHEVAVRVLLEKGADIESKDLGGRTPLQWAAKGNHEAVTELLLEMGAIIDSRDLFGQTPLIQVAKGGHQTVARLLLAKDADMESKDCRGHSPLSWAAKNGDVVITKLLLEKGATVESKDKTRQTPLSWAARMGHENVVMLLLEKDADVESKDLRDQTPLLHAVKNGHKTIVKLLLEKGADIMANYEDGQTSGLSCSAEA
jgi:ankyrin repeat protein